jgi:hypothetical protein
VRLSVCLIVRDNEPIIQACLDSVRPWGEELVVVDTGSKDSTPDIARRNGARLFYVDNRALGLVDPSGELSIGAYLHIPASCGQFCTASDWKLGAGEALGFIIQKLSLTGAAIDCSRTTSAYFATCGRGLDWIRGGPASAVAGAGTLEYWELWPVVGGELRGTRTLPVRPGDFHDRVGLKLPLASYTVRDFEIEAIAWFVAGAVPPGGWDLWSPPGAIAGAGGLHAICDADAIAAGLAVPAADRIVRRWSFAWECCCPVGCVSYMRHTIHSPGRFAVYSDEFEGCWVEFEDCRTKRIYLPNVPTESVHYYDET